MAPVLGSWARRSAAPPGVVRPLFLGFLCGSAQLSQSREVLLREMVTGEGMGGVPLASSAPCGEG